MTKIEAIIQRDIKDDGRVCYYVVPSLRLGLTAKCGNHIVNDRDDPLWETIDLYATHYLMPATQRVRVTVAEDEPGGYDNVTVVSVEAIEG